MDTDRAGTRNELPPAAGGKFLWRGFALWMLLGPVIGVAVGWVAVVAQSYFAPLVLFPLLVGVLLGAMLIGLMRLGQVGNRPTIVLGTVLAASVTACAEHYLAYLTTGGRPPPDVKAQQFTPQDFSKLVNDWDPSFAEFMRRKAARGLELVPGWQIRGWALWLAWSIDGLLVLLAALGLVVLAMRQPYCNRCRSWLRPIRSGRIDAHTARRLAELAGLPEAKQPVSARYRLLCCNSGCGPTGLELSCEESEGGISSARAWLDADRRLSIMQMLDESQAPSPNP